MWLIPPGLVTVLVTASGAFTTGSLVGQIETGVTPELSSFSPLFAGLVLVYVVSALFFLAWTAAVVVTADEYAHSTDPRLGSVLMRTLRRYPATLLSGLVYGLAMIVLILVASGIGVLFVLAFPVSLIAILAAIAGGAMWAFQPRARSIWLKWLIILATPFGLPIYFGGMWSMYLCAAVLERHGPLGALRRSTQLVDRHWFRVVAILFVAGMIVSILQSAPTMLVQLPLTISALLRGQTRPERARDGGQHGGQRRGPGPVCQHGADRLRHGLRRPAQPARRHRPRRAPEPARVRLRHLLAFARACRWMRTRRWPACT